MVGQTMEAEAHQTQLPRPQLMADPRVVEAHHSLPQIVMRYPKTAEEVQYL